MCGSSFQFSEQKIPPFFDIRPTAVDAPIGSAADFECHVTGTQPIKVSWAKDNREIRPGGNYKITCVENRPRLKILKVSKVDSGLYTCLASNDIGKDSCTAQLGVQGIY